MLEVVDDTDLDALARLARDGHQGAFERLATAAFVRARRWALPHVAQPDEAEDVAQEVIIRLHGGLSNFQFDARITTWLYRITRNALADWHRSGSRRRSRDQRFAGDVDEAHTPDPALDERRAGHLIRQWFLDLPARQREVFDLVDLQGHTSAEAAVLLRLEPVTVRVHLLRARRTIRQRMLDEETALAEDLS